MLIAVVVPDTDDCVRDMVVCFLTSNDPVELDDFIEFDSCVRLYVYSITEIYLEVECSKQSRNKQCTPVMLGLITCTNHVMDFHSFACVKTLKSFKMWACAALTTKSQPHFLGSTQAMGTSQYLCNSTHKCHMLGRIVCSSFVLRTQLETIQGYTLTF